jgi:hypothetical protein
MSDGTCWNGGHTEALDLIDTQDVKNTGNAALRKHLNDTRGHVAKHLD